MSNKNRMQRRGQNLVLNDSVLGGAVGELAGAIGYQTSGSGTAALEYMYTRILTGISMSRFTWKGLPDSVSRRWLETCLLTQALAIFFRDEETGNFFATQGTPTGNYNMVGDPTEFQAVSANNYRWWTLSAVGDDAECVPIWANELRTPDIDIIRIYAHDLAESHRTRQINMMNLRQPKVVAFPESLNLTVQNFLDQVNAGSGAIKVDSDFGESIEKVFQVLDLSVHPDLILGVDIIKSRVWTEAMTMLGVNTAPNQDKKERLVAAEISGNDDIIEMIREKNLESRRVACEQINKKYNLNISVDYASDMNKTALKDVGQGEKPQQEVE